ARGGGAKNASASGPWGSTGSSAGTKSARRGVLRAVGFETGSDGGASESPQPGSGSAGGAPRAGSGGAFGNGPTEPISAVGVDGDDAAEDGFAGGAGADCRPEFATASRG